MASPLYRVAAPLGGIAVFWLKRRGDRADASGMGSHAKFQSRRDFAPMSNAERQRRFRERHPDYYRRLHAARRAGVIARGVANKLAAQAVAAEAVAHREPLMLPAPVELLEIPGLNAIPTTMPAREAVEVAVTQAD